jgi:hypothetical protein
MLRLIPLLAAALVTGCAAQVDEPSITDLHPLDVEPVEDGKADGASFSRTRIVSDEAFTDAFAMSADEVQAFLLDTPYGNRSFLADEVTHGQPLSASLVRVARESGLNPLVLLSTLQKEAGLVSKTAAPSRFRVDYAFGCGCHDGQGCYSGYRGLDRQLECAAEVLQTAYVAGATGGVTQAGTRLGESFRTLDDYTIVADNSATLALYVYTPWVGRRARSGNWLFHNIWTRYTSHVEYQDPAPPPTFIGSPCTIDADCTFAGGVCLEQNGGLFCSQRCDRFCPDREGFPTTFCVDFFGEGRGYCASRCDSRTECNEGQYCEPRGRNGDPATTQSVCTY